MMARPRTIQIYLPKSVPLVLRVADLTTSIVRVIEVPRKLFDRFLEMLEAKQVAVYFLINDNEDQDYPSVYIGQTGGAGQRLVDHHKLKEFWNRALVIVFLTNSLTQTHALYLEWLGIKKANEAKRYKVENGNASTKPHTPAPIEADCQEVFETMSTLIATLGQPLFESFIKEKTEQPFLRSTEYEAVGQYTEEGIVVLAGSKARKDIAASMANTPHKPKRQGLIDDGALKLEGYFCVFQRDVLFKSPSRAAGNGPRRQFQRLGRMGQQSRQDPGRAQAPSTPK